MTRLFKLFLDLSKSFCNCNQKECGGTGTNDWLLLHNDIKPSVKAVSFLCKSSVSKDSSFLPSNNFSLSFSLRTGVLLFINCWKILLEEFKAFSKSILSFWYFFFLFHKMFANAFALSSITRIAEPVLSGKVSRKTFILKSFGTSFKFK